MLAVILVIIGLTLIGTFFFIKSHLNKGEKKQEVPNLQREKKEEQPLEKIDNNNQTFDIRNNQSIEIDSSSTAIKKIIRKYKNINSLQVEEVSTEQAEKTQNEFDKINIIGSAIEEDDDESIDFESITGEMDRFPDLQELSFVKEVEETPGQELFKIIDTSLHEKVTNQLERLVSGDEDDDLLDEFNKFKTANSYAENTNSLFDELDDEEINISEPNKVTSIIKEINTGQKDEIITDEREKTSIFTEKIISPKEIVDNHLDFNMEFDELVENED